MSNKVYEIITEKIITQLENGVVPWKQPWVGGRPMNLVSKRPYRGVNNIILGCQYASPYWLSYKQAQQLGGHVKKGQKSTMVVFWKQLTVEETDRETGEKKGKTIPMLRYYRVFNVEQCEGIDPKKIPVTDINLDFQSIDACEGVVSDMQNRPDIRHREQRAYYQPGKDFVNMPKKGSFFKEEFYYSVLFHELGHSTGHEKRCGRKKINEWASFGSESYSKEELVAEMTAAFLCGHCRIEQQTLDDSASYIKSWLGKLKDDCKMVVLAAAQAQKAADYILGET